MNNAIITALDFLSDAGVTQSISDAPNNRFTAKSDLLNVKKTAYENSKKIIEEKENNKPNITTSSPVAPHSDIIDKAITICKNADTLEKLENSIQNFDGLSLKKTATNLVFSDGNQHAKIMVIGDAPLTDDDRTGKPFSGEHGALLDKIFECIGLSRSDENANNSIYLSNLLNWRPPGNRTPTVEEIEISAPFIKRHIELIKPEFLVIYGAISAKTLLNVNLSISKLRGKTHKYNENTKIIATYPPSVLLCTPLQKKKAWEDMLLLQGMINE